MNSKFADIISRYEEIVTELSNPNTLSDHNRFKALSIEQSSLLPFYEKVKVIRDLELDITQAEELLKNEESAEFQDFYKNTIAESSKKVEQLSKELEKEMATNNADDNRSAIIEIRAGTGGDEASLFAGDLYRMYHRYAENN